MKLLNFDCVLCLYVNFVMFVSKFVCFFFVRLIVLS